MDRSQINTLNLTVTLNVLRIISNKKNTWVVPIFDPCQIIILTPPNTKGVIIWQRSELGTTLESHNSTNPGLSSTVGVFQSRFVPYHHRRVAVPAVPGALAAAQVVGGRRALQLMLLLLPDQQRGVLEAQSREALRQRLLR